MSKSFDLNGERNFSKNYLLPVLLVYLVMEIALIVLVPLVLPPSITPPTK